MSERGISGAGVCVMLLNEDKILLGKRHSNPEKADSRLHGEGTWTMPGGKLTFGSSFEDGAAREVEEECGIDIDTSTLKFVSITNDIVEDAHFITIGFTCDTFSGEPKVMEPDEITEWKWFSLYDLPSPMFPPSGKAIKNYINKNIYSVIA